MESVLMIDQGRKREKLASLIDVAFSRSPFYREKYKAVANNGIDELTTLKRDEYYKAMESQPFPLMVGEPENGYYFTSGGTTGKVKLTFWNNGYVEKWVDQCFLSLRSTGLEAGDRVANLFFPGIWATHSLINRSLERVGCTILPIGGDLENEKIIDFMIDFNINTLIGVPSFIVGITEYIESLPDGKKEQIHIHKIFYAGEFLSQTQYNYLKSVYHITGETGVINPFIYSSTDTGAIGIKCPFCEKDQYHIADSIFLEQNGSGDLVISSLINSATPTIRYEVGDRAIFNERECPCGNKAPLFTLLGRTDSEFKIAGYLVNPETIGKALSKTEEISRNFQIIVSESEHKVKLTINCEINNYEEFSESGINSLKMGISRDIINSSDVIRKVVALKYALEPEIQIGRIGFIPRNNDTGKISILKDLR